MSGAIHGELDGIAQDAQGLQAISDNQASTMHALASTMEGLGSTLQGAAGIQMQSVGEQLHAQGMRFSTTFAEHSQKMANNASIFESHDSDGASVIAQVSGLIT